MRKEGKSHWEGEGKDSSRPAWMPPFSCQKKRWAPWQPLTSWRVAPWWARSRPLTRKMSDW